MGKAKVNQLSAAKHDRYVLGTSFSVMRGAAVAKEYRHSRVRGYRLTQRLAGTRFPKPPKSIRLVIKDDNYT